MNKIHFCAVGLVILAGVSASCSSSPPLVAPTHAPFSLPTLIPPTKVPGTPTALASATSAPPPPTQTLLPVAAITVAATLGPTGQVSPIVGSPTASALPTVTPAQLPSPTSAIPRGLYVADLRIDPPPVRGPDLRFYATFLNAMDQEQNSRWAVYIFRADTQRGIGETTRTDSAIPAGTVEQPSSGSWKLSAGGPCEYLYAQVGWINAENKIVWFTTPSGSVFQKGFTVCPP